MIGFSNKIFLKQTSTYQPIYPGREKKVKQIITTTSYDHVNMRQLL